MCYLVFSVCVYFVCVLVLNVVSLYVWEFRDRELPETYR